LLGGLYAGDVDRLSVQATFPELPAWERAQGSLIRGAQAARRHVRGDDVTPMFLRPRGGTRALTEALAARLGERVRTGTEATAVRASPGGGWGVETGGPTGAVAGDAVVLAVPAAPTQRLLHPVARAAAEELSHLRAVSTGVVALVYPSGTAQALPNGSGFVVPRGEAPFTAVTWLSNKWPDPAFGTRAVLRCFVGADGDEDVLDEPDDDIVEACARHLSAVHPLPEPEHAAVIRWPGSMPQPELGHLDRVARIRAHLPAGVVVTGQPYDGVGVPDCVRAADEAAAAVLDHLRNPR
jgi:oxygen-dependent protoporphyrinogen oxidase